MTSSLGSMTSSCLQQRDGYPYMFHDPLTLSSQYAAHAAHSRTQCNPSAAHQQPPPPTPTSQHSSYSGGNGTGTASTGMFINYFLL